MARPQKKGFDYFPLDVGFFYDDRKIKMLRARYGADGVVVYLYLLCEVYKNGFFTKLDKDFEYIIADDLNMSEEKIRQIIAFLAERSLFDGTLLSSDTVLTSVGIQKRWQEMVKGRASKTPPEIDSRYWLLSESETEEVLRAVLGFSENNNDFSANNPDNSEENAIKESKEVKCKSKTESKQENQNKSQNVPIPQQQLNNADPPIQAHVMQYMLTLGVDTAFNEAKVFIAYNAKRGWDCLPDWKLAADLWCARILEFKSSRSKDKEDMDGYEN